MAIPSKHDVDVTALALEMDYDERWKLRRFYDLQRRRERRRKMVGILGVLALIVACAVAVMVGL